MTTSTFSIVIETENLAFGGVADLERCLGSLASQTLDVRRANEVWILVGGHLDAADAEAIGKRYPWARIHEANSDLNYLAAKRLGAELSTGDCVVYADSDVAYDPSWLEATMQVFAEHADATVVCSDTRIPIDSSYGFAIQIVWVLPTLKTGGEVRGTDSFRLNNFAIKRAAMLNSTFEDQLPVFRGGIGRWRKQLRNAGARFYRVPRVLALHLAPQGLAEWWHRMLVFGADPVAMANYRQLPGGGFVERPSLPRRLWRAVKWVSLRAVKMVEGAAIIVSEEPRTARYLPLGALIALGSFAVLTLGSLVTVFNSRLVFDRVVAFENRD